MEPTEEDMLEIGVAIKTTSSTDNWKLERKQRGKELHFIKSKQAKKNQVLKDNAAGKGEGEQHGQCRQGENTDC